MSLYCVSQPARDREMRPQSYGFSTTYPSPWQNQASKKHKISGRIIDIAPPFTKKAPRLSTGELPHINSRQLAIRSPRCFTGGIYTQ